MGFNVAAGRFGQPNAYPVRPERSDDPRRSSSGSSFADSASSSSGRSSDSDSPPGSPYTSRSSSGHNFGTTVDPVFSLVPPDQGGKIQKLFDAWAVYADSRGKKGKKELVDTLAVVIQLAADALLSKHTRILDYDPGKQDGVFAFTETVDGKRQFRVFDRNELKRDISSMGAYEWTLFADNKINREFVSLFAKVQEIYLTHRKNQSIVDLAILAIVLNEKDIPTAGQAIQKAQKSGIKVAAGASSLGMITRVMAAARRTHEGNLAVCPKQASQLDQVQRGKEQRCREESQQARLQAAQNDQRAALAAQVLNAEVVTLPPGEYKRFLAELGVH